MKTKLYPHTTDGGAQYLMDAFIQCPGGHKEGVCEGAKYIIRLDGHPEIVRAPEPAAKHTPGPWTAASQDIDTNEIPIKCGKSILARVAPRPHWDATQEANARLIASAPELLEALKNLVSMGWNDSPLCKVYEKEIQAAEKAISQAEGGAQ